jgi:DNA replication licensing factor MCM7
VSEQISTFLSTFVGQDKDIERGMADVAIGDDEDDGSASTIRGLKYMQQLVRVSPTTRRRSLITAPATNSQSGTTDACHPLGRYTQSEHISRAPNIFLWHVQYEKTVTELVSRILLNTRRYVDLFSDVVDQLMPIPTKDITEHDEVIDVILHQRRERNEQIEGTQDGFPSHLLRR